MKVSELIEELKKVPPETEVTFNLHTESKVYGKQVYKNVWFNHTYTGACLNIPLPGPAYIAKWPEKF